MQLNVLEKKQSKMKIEIVDETHTLLNLLRENSWKKGAKQASYIIEHPYLSQPKIVVSGENPRKVLNDASQLIIDDAEEFSKQFKRAVKK
jgi:DNA-directed RNA polymerase subunit L